MWGKSQCSKQSQMARIMWRTYVHQKRRELKMISYKCLKGYTQGRSKDWISVRQESLLKIEPCRRQELVGDLCSTRNVEDWRGWVISAWRDKKGLKIMSDSGQGRSTLHLSNPKQKQRTRQNTYKSNLFTISKSTKRVIKVSVVLCLLFKQWFLCLELWTNNYE